MRVPLLGDWWTPRTVRGTGDTHLAIRQTQRNYELNIHGSGLIDSILADLM
jgi:hypothetical protein